LDVPCWVTFWADSGCCCWLSCVTSLVLLWLYFETEQMYCSSYKNNFFHQYSYFVSGNLKLLTRLTHPFTIFIYYWTWI
jgi:phosphate starvation-inducible membrane PsiE